MAMSTDTSRVMLVSEIPQAVPLHCLSDCLADQGHTVISAHRHQTLVHARRHCPALILLDSASLDQATFPLCQQLTTHAETKAIPVMVILPQGASAQGTDCLLNGAIDYVTFSESVGETEEAIARIHARLQHHHALRQSLPHAQAHQQSQLHTQNDTVFPTVSINPRLDPNLFCQKDSQTDWPQPLILPQHSPQHSPQQWLESSHDMGTIRQPNQSRQYPPTPHLRKEQWRLSPQPKSYPGNPLAPLPLSAVKLEQQVAQRIARLETINQELESFAYSVSHDLRAPLRQMRGFIHTLRQSLEHSNVALTPTIVHYLSVIEASSHSMGLLLDRLLMLSGIGRHQFNTEAVDLNPLLQPAIQALEGLEQGSALKAIEWTIGHLPTVEGDPILLHQVFVNLLENAVKFSRDRPSPHISITATPDGAIVVRDNGVGFSMDHAKQLFVPFERLHSPQDFGGSGLGLSIVQRIIHCHGGQLWAESSPGKGAAFFFTLPLSEPASPSADS